MTLNDPIRYFTLNYGYCNNSNNKKTSINNNNNNNKNRICIARVCRMTSEALEPPLHVQLIVHGLHSAALQLTELRKL